jgi:hypothetical protein
MKIEFSRSGGFAAPAMKQKIEIDTAELPPGEASQLESLVEGADLASLASQDAQPPRPDEFRYRITVDDDEGHSYTATTSDADMPEAVGPLVDWLSKRASEGG